jgi:hypothetical protein
VIYRQEQGFGTEWAEGIAEALGQTLKTEVRREFVRQHGADGISVADVTLSPEVMALATAFYKDDFERFGY